MSDRIYVIDMSELTTSRLEVLRDALQGEVADEFNQLTAMVNGELFLRRLSDASTGFNAVRTCVHALLDAGYGSIHDRSERDALDAAMRKLVALLGFDAGPEREQAMLKLYERDDGEPHAIHASCVHCGQDIEGWTDSDEWRDRGNNPTCNNGGQHRPLVEPPL